MTAGSRSNLVTRAAAQLQGAFERRRAAVRSGFEGLCEQGAFRAPEHLAPALQGDLGLGLMCPLPVDASRAEAG